MAERHAARYRRSVYTSCFNGHRAATVSRSSRAGRRRRERPTIGYLARMCADKGLPTSRRRVPVAVARERDTRCPDVRLRDRWRASRRPRTGRSRASSRGVSRRAGPGTTSDFLTRPLDRETKIELPSRRCPVFSVPASLRRVLRAVPARGAGLRRARRAAARRVAFPRSSRRRAAAFCANRRRRGRGATARTRSRALAGSRITRARAGAARPRIAVFERVLHVGRLHGARRRARLYDCRPTRDTPRRPPPDRPS